MTATAQSWRKRAALRADRFVFVAPCFRRAASLRTACVLPSFFQLSRGVVGRRDMHGFWEKPDATATEKRRIKRRNEREPEERFGPFIFPAVCRRLSLSAKDLARIGASHPRTAEFWLSGTVEAPPIVQFVIWTEALRHDRERRALGK